MVIIDIRYKYTTTSRHTYRGVLSSVAVLLKIYVQDKKAPYKHVKKKTGSLC